MDRAARNWREGKVMGFDRVATYSADGQTCFVEVEGYRAKIGGSAEPATITRREIDGWKIVCLHADPRGLAVYGQADASRPLSFDIVLGW